MWRTNFSPQNLENAIIGGKTVISMTFVSTKSSLTRKVVRLKNSKRLSGFWQIAFELAKSVDVGTSGFTILPTRNWLIGFEDKANVLWMGVGLHFAFTSLGESGAHSLLCGLLPFCCCPFTMSKTDYQLNLNLHG